MENALRAELQNILNDLKYNKLTDSIDKLKTITSKYLKMQEMEIKVFYLHLQSLLEK